MRALSARCYRRSLPCTISVQELQSCGFVLRAGLAPGSRQQLGFLCPSPAATSLTSQGMAECTDCKRGLIYSFPQGWMWKLPAYFNWKENKKEKYLQPRSEKSALRCHYSDWVFLCYLAQSWMSLMFILVPFASFSMVYFSLRYRSFLCFVAVIIAGL